MLDQKFPKHLEPDVWTCSFAPANTSCASSALETMAGANHKILVEGSEWQSYTDGFKPCLREYERESGYTTKIIKKDNKQAKLQCSISTCAFTLKLNCRPKDKMWYVSQKSSKMEHDCDITKHAVPPAPRSEIIALFLTITSLRTNYHHGVIFNLTPTIRSL